MTKPDLQNYHAGVTVSWGITADIKPGSVPDRPVPHSRTGSTYRPERIWIHFEVQAKANVTRVLSLASPQLKDEARSRVELTEAKISGRRIKIDGTPGQVHAEERFSAYDWKGKPGAREIPDWLRELAETALRDLRDYRTNTARE